MIDSTGKTPPDHGLFGAASVAKKQALNLDHVAKEIAANLNELEIGVKNKTADRGFIDIFADDIQKLKENGYDKDKIKILENKLNSLNDAILGIQESSYFPPERPLVGNPTSLQQVAETYTPGSVQTGLVTLHTANYAMIPIAAAVKSYLWPPITPLIAPAITFAVGDFFTNLFVKNVENRHSYGKLMVSLWNV